MGKWHRGNCLPNVLGLSGSPKIGHHAHLPHSKLQGYMARYQQSLAREAVEAYAKVAAEHGLTPTQLALAWCRSRWFVTSTIIGATTMEQLKVGAQGGEGEGLIAAAG